MANGLEADFLILADSAQVQGEKLFMLGGGWSQVWVKQFPAQHQMAVAAGILIPWMETNARHQFNVRVRDEEGAVFSEVSGSFEQGRPPGLPAGATQRMMLAINLTIRMEKPCEAVAELSLDEKLAKSVPFRVVESAPR